MEAYYSRRNSTLLILLSVLALVHIVFEWRETGDFLIYFQASKDLLSGYNIFTRLYGTDHALPYFGSPTLALLLAPISFLPFPFAAALFKLCSLLLLWRIWVLLEKFINPTVFTPKQYSIFIVASFVGMGFFLYRNFHLNQLTIFLLWSCLESVFQAQKDRWLPAGLILALGIMSKILPIAFLPYFLYRAYFRAAGGAIVFTLFFLLMPALFLSWHHFIDLSSSWWLAINPSKGINVLDYQTEDIHTVAVWLSSLLLPKVGLKENTLPISRNIVSLPIQTVIWVIQFVRIALILCTVYFMRTLPFKREKNNFFILWEIGYICMVIPLVFPQQRLYAFLFFLPAIVYLNYFFVYANVVVKYNQQRFYTFIYVYIASLFIFNLELIVGNFREYYWHFKTVTYAALLLMGVYALLRPSRLKSLTNAWKE
ncbi:MAG: DUF2029 domain-containing protein [Bacteroidetes bacterium]|nr:DUF2029 domain-containing protein [Bacteroidota bacterium]MBS1741100.1 DUF2029 domain-containing protein [Bacteroidota bacterium]